ncbi:hypothetical protein GBAR_LOCUS22725 [Geodia barretti]|uniref:Uncharacterized protein n=1 Tax=Geodia barretti TaxID=519541 RepID=A0AA35X7U5_GEOBA|nr:hypothetical protein GBAR_LOCUS22725 [Geodia barretti]
MNGNFDRQGPRLADHHGWTNKLGNRVFVTNKGALRFKVPDVRRRQVKPWSRPPMTKWLKDYLDDDSSRALRVWSDALGTLKLDEYIGSPFRGPGR